MNRAVTAKEERVEIPGICFIRKPEDVLRCTLSAGHYGDHRHFYSGEFRNGVRVGTAWPGWPGETQAD